VGGGVCVCVCGREYVFNEDAVHSTHAVVRLCCSVLQYVQCVAVCCRVLPCVAVCCSVVWCVAVKESEMCVLKSDVYAWVLVCVGERKNSVYMTTGSTT